MATPITSIDQANVTAVTNNVTYNISGSIIGQIQVNYLLAPKFSFTGTLNLNDNSVEFGYGILQAPGPVGGVIYPATSKQDFQFYLNGVRIEDDEVLGFSEDVTNTNCTASFGLGFALRSYDVVTAVGKFRV